MSLLILLATSAVGLAAPGVLKPGSSGEDVRYIQNLLAEKGYYQDEVDGIYGNGTVQAVKDFQSISGINPDGNVGPETRACLERSSTEASRSGRVLTMTATAYTAYDGGSGFTYQGNRVHKGIVAVDPNRIPLGTHLYIDGYGQAIADDIGGSINGNDIDLGFDSRSEALQFGRRTVNVHILD